MRVFASAAALAIAALSSFALAQSVHPNRLGWLVEHKDQFSNNSRCQMMAVFADADMIISASIYMRKPYFEIRFMNLNWQNLTQAGQTYPVRLVFDGGIPAVAGDFTGINYAGYEEEMGVVGLGPNLFMRTDHDQMGKILTPLGKASTMRLEVNGRDAGTYSLHGSQQGVVDLVDCVARQLSRASENPFRP